ncbi:RNA 3'-terminal phosphate cyclase-like protein [Rhodotorula toruloides]|uniref:RNA 3'-terminal phosphate cyclase-like protein n=1 Tax=Rhodotorula toruloides TaxID=5286 RepID=A0A511KPX5_RHOTO|nr:RNA 3'-terminal phosphate cyclase-like protein [Rhodotorula toruloides]
MLVVVELALDPPRPPAMAAQRSTPSTTPPTPSSSSTPVPTSSSRVLHFTGHSRFRHRLILSLLSRRPVRIDRIRPDDDNPGLKVYEVSFLRLVEKLTQGSKVEISYTGTSVLFHPGTIQHGQVTHQCPLERGVGWFLEPLLAIAPFGKKDLSLTLRGVTTDGRDASVDVVRTSGLPHLAMFLDKEGVELRITKRGHPPLGGGEVTLTCPSVRSIKSGFEFTSLGRISKIRGIAHSVRVSPQLANRLVASARSVLNRYIPDIYIYTDVYRGEDSGKSPGYAITLVASSTSHVLHSSESSSCPSRSTSSSSPQTPEDLGLIAARQLLTEIARGGCVDRGWEWLVTTMLVLGGEDVGKVRVAGPLEAGLIAHLRDLKAFFGTTFKIKPVASLPSTAADAADEGGGGGKERDEYVLSCVGTGFVNTARRAG